MYNWNLCNYFIINIIIIIITVEFLAQCKDNFATQIQQVPFSMAIGNVYAAIYLIAILNNCFSSQPSEVKSIFKIIDGKEKVEQF